MSDLPKRLRRHADYLDGRIGPTLASTDCRTAADKLACAEAALQQIDGAVSSSWDDDARAAIIRRVQTLAREALAPTPAPPTLSAKQLDTLRHMLGINTPDVRVPKPSRDYYCANHGDPEMVALEKLGAVERYSVRDGYDWYRCTAMGRAAALASHRAIQRTKSQRVYSSFLSHKDCIPDLSFWDFLTDPQYANARRDA